MPMETTRDRLNDVYRVAFGARKRLDDLKRSMQKCLDQGEMFTAPTDPEKLEEVLGWVEALEKDVADALI